MDNRNTVWQRGKFAGHGNSWVPAAGAVVIASPQDAVPQCSKQSVVTTATRASPRAGTLFARPLSPPQT